MSDVMLLGVLKMPINCWVDSALDAHQRHSRYLEAAKRIEEQQAYIEQLEQALVEITDGTMRTWYDLHEHTGLRFERCKEIVELLEKLFEKKFS